MAIEAFKAHAEELYTRCAAEFGPAMERLASAYEADASYWGSKLTGFGVVLAALVGCTLSRTDGSMRKPLLSLGWAFR